MKRVRYIENEDTDDQETHLYEVEEFILSHTENRFLSTFLRIQFDKGLITFDELLEILHIKEKEFYSLINW